MGDRRLLLEDIIAETPFKDCQVDAFVFERKIALSTEDEWHARVLGHHTDIAREAITDDDLENELVDEAIEAISRLTRAGITIVIFKSESFSEPIVVGLPETQEIFIGIKRDRDQQKQEEKKERKMAN